MNHFFHVTKACTSILSLSSASSLPVAWENQGREHWIPVHTTVSVTQEILQNPFVEQLWKIVIQFIH